MPDFGGGGGGQAEAYQQAGAAQAEAARYAADLQYKASQESNALIKEMYQTGRSDLAPWRATGQIALDVYSGLLGLPSAYSTKLPNLPGQTPAQPGTGTGGTGTGTGTTGNVLMGGGGYVFDPTMGVWTPYAKDQKFYQDSYGNLYPSSMIQKYPNYDNVFGQMGGSAPSGYKYIATAKDGTQMEVTPAASGPVSPSATFSPGAGNQTTPTTNANVLAQYNKAISAPSDRMNATEWVKQTPGYEFQFGEGVNALDRSAASRGMLLSGAQGRALTEYGQNFALGHYNTLMDRLASMAGIGQSTASQTGQMGQNMAAQSAANTMAAAQGAGQARMAGAEAIGSGYINAANAAAANRTSNINTLMSLPTAAYGMFKLGTGIASLFSSDKRTKRDIVPVSDYAIGKIESLIPVKFQYLPEWGGGPEQVGFVADDLENIIPEAVVKNQAGIRMINPMPIIAYLVKAMQEQQMLIDDLRGLS